MIAAGETVSMSSARNPLNLITIFLAGLLLLVACSGADALSEAQEGSPETSTPSDGISALPTSVQEVAQPESGLGFAPGSPELKATDPETVSLASGQIQFLEFFAFW